MNNNEWQVFIYIMSLNICLSLVHYLLEKIKDKTESDIDNRLYDLVIKLEDVLRWITGNRK
jgi:hypothetical protein